MSNDVLNFDAGSSIRSNGQNTGFLTMLHIFTETVFLAPSNYFPSAMLPAELAGTQSRLTRP